MNRWRQKWPSGGALSCPKSGQLAADPETVVNVPPQIDANSLRRLPLWKNNTFSAMTEKSKGYQLDIIDFHLVLDFIFERGFNITL
ncbi:hypothetical protein CDAR_524611 [Caerostris darwini]|uniref:Uncharacterized protein n=1 Tax=Caerostris darwini TaxID=1538125 RepID=A0AAV4PTM8_9ARAC|nr:hypothetical protein CDAR_524611 [Caerostris darwini]